MPGVVGSEDRRRKFRDLQFDFDRSACKILFLQHPGLRKLGRKGVAISRFSIVANFFPVCEASMRYPCIIVFLLPGKL